MKLNQQIKTILPLAAFAGLTLSANAAATIFDFGTMNTTGDGATGWSFSSSGPDSTDNGSPDIPAFFSSGAGDGSSTANGGLGTSDGDLLAAGDYTISYKYSPYSDAGASLIFRLYAWDGSTQTLLATQNPTDPGSQPDWQTLQMTFSTPTGSGLIGQQLQFEARADGTGSYAAWDTITGDFTAVPEPTTTALLGLGGFALILRRRK